MILVKRSTQVEAPLEKVFHQLTQFHEYPLFMTWLTELQHHKDRLHWRATLRDTPRLWESRILQLRPRQRIAWASLNGADPAGAFELENLGPFLTKITYTLTFPHQYFAKREFDAEPLLAAQMNHDLANLKNLLESRAAQKVWNSSPNLLFVW